MKWQRGPSEPSKVSSDSMSDSSPIITRSPSSISTQVSPRRPPSSALRDKSLRSYMLHLALRASMSSFCNLHHLLWSSSILLSPYPSSCNFYFQGDSNPYSFIVFLPSLVASSLGKGNPWSIFPATSKHVFPLPAASPFVGGVMTSESNQASTSLGVSTP